MTGPIQLTAADGHQLGAYRARPENRRANWRVVRQPLATRLGKANTRLGGHRQNGPKASYALTIKPDHALGADHAIEFNINPPLTGWKRR